MTRALFRAAAATAVCTLLSITVAFADTVGTVRGTLEHDGQPLAHATVHLSGERLVQDATTDASGRFAFPRIPFGRYELTSQSGGSSARAEIDVASDAVVDVRLVLLHTIVRTVTTTRSVRGTPVSENGLSARSIAALPRNDSLNALIQTVPGVVRFSYNEPVAHGFHGLTYELDGAPLPQSTSSNFSELVDPRTIDSLEVFTGAFPAEFGGSRQGAVVNIRTRAPDQSRQFGGNFTLGTGNNASGETRLLENFGVGSTRIALSANTSRTNRGIDAPTFFARHDAGNLSDEFLRLTSPLAPHTTLAFDLSNQFAAFQIPINTVLGSNNPVVCVPGTDDVQREYDRFASLSIAHTSADGLGYLQIVPWVRYTRIAYDGDLPRDVLGTFTDPSGNVTPLSGLRQDRHATYTGVRASALRASQRHAVKVGVDLSRENFQGNVLIRIPSSPDFTDNVSQAGTQFGAYAEDRWAATPNFAINAGVRYDHSTGFVSGAQLSPRIEANLALSANTILHSYFGRLYAAPALEDTRRAAVITQTSPTTAPLYDLKPERDSYLEVGVSHTFRPGLTGYINAFNRTAVNVLDTTQLNNTPLFAVFNNAVGVARGVELRLVADNAGRDSFFLSTTFSHATAGGVSGSTFLFPPSAASDLSLQPEDHDQMVAVQSAYTRRWAADRRSYATLGAEFGSGFPVAFQNGNARLPSHLTFDASFGRTPDPQGHEIGYSVSLENLLDKPYLLKVNNGFNTTQWAPGLRFAVRFVLPT